MYKLKYKDIATVRNAYLYINHLICPLCEREVNKPVLDHNHKTGIVRNTICHSCNQMLGKIENNMARFGLKDYEVLRVFLNNVTDYMQLESEHIHPTFKEKSPKIKK